MDRRSTFLWMRDILDHLSTCCEQWEDADADSERFLAESMRRDMDELRRLCQTVRQTSRRQTAAFV